MNVFLILKLWGKPTVTQQLPNSYPTAPQQLPSNNKIMDTMCPFLFVNPHEFHADSGVDGSYFVIQG